MKSQASVAWDGSYHFAASFSESTCWLDLRHACDECVLDIIVSMRPEAGTEDVLLQAKVVPTIQVSLPSIRRCLRFAMARKRRSGATGVDPTVERKMVVYELAGVVFVLP